MNSTGTVSIADLRDRLAALTAGLKTLHTNIFQCPTGELGDFLGELAELRALAGAGAVLVTTDAETRGVVEASQSASTRGWVAEHGWHSRREAATIAKAAHILRRPDLAEITDSIRTADLDLSTAVVVQAEYDKLAPELVPGAHRIVLEQLVNHGSRTRPARRPRTAAVHPGPPREAGRVHRLPGPLPPPHLPLARPGNLSRTARIPPRRRQRRSQHPRSRDPGALGTATRSGDRRP